MIEEDTHENQSIFYEKHTINSTKKKFVKNVWFCGIAASVIKTFSAPFERVKIVLQTQDVNRHVRDGGVNKYRGSLGCFTGIYKDQGILSLWRGNSVNIARNSLTQGFCFTFKDILKQLLPTYSSKDNFGKFVMVNVFSGGLAGAGSLCIVYPLDYARTRLASDVGSGRQTFSGLGDCLLKTSKGPRGFFALYNGLGVSVLGSAVYRGIYFGMYDTIASTYLRDDANELKGFVGHVTAALCTSITAGVMSYPLDTVRRRLQMQSELLKEDRCYKNARDCFRTILRDEGVSGFWKGAGVNVMRSLSGAVGLVAYGELKKMAHLSVGDEEITLV